MAGRVASLTLVVLSRYEQNTVKSFCPYVYKTMGACKNAQESGVARPSKFDKASAVEQAMHLIWRDGYEASSVKAMSENLGITRSSYYNACGSRDGLFKQALAAYAQLSPDHILYDAPEMPIRSLFTKVFCDACQARAADPEARGCLAVNSVGELVGNPDHAELGIWLADQIRGSIGRIEALLQIGKDSGELSALLDVRPTALAVQVGLMGINTISKVERDCAELTAAAEATLRGLDLWADLSEQ